MAKIQLPTLRSFHGKHYGIWNFQSTGKIDWKKAVSFISFDENKFIWSFHTKFFLQQIIYSHKVDLT